jgi:cytochrome c biogenesis protein CcmG/thiol:disulfide interchange protein DsbE
MIRRVLYVLPVLLFLALATYFALALRPDHDANFLPSALIDKPVPQFDLASLTGGDNVSAAGLKGHVVVINFFASWCVPCRIEHPILTRLASQEHLPLYGIAYKDRDDATRDLLSQFGDPFLRIGVDADGRTGLNFGVYGVPETYVIDKSGRIRQRFVGPLSAEVVERELLPLVKALERS